MLQLRQRAWVAAYATAFIVTFACANVATAAGASPAPSPSPSPDATIDPNALHERVRELRLRVAKMEARFYRPGPGATPNINDLSALSPFFPKPHAFDPHGGATATMYRDTGVVREAYESHGTLFFPIDRSPTQGIHHFIFARHDADVTTVALSMDDPFMLTFSSIATDEAILKGSDQGGRMSYWRIRDGAVDRIAAPRSEGAYPFGPPVAKTCSVVNRNVTFFDVDGNSTISARELSNAAGGIALEDGIAIGCRQMGTMKLVWLSADQNSDDGGTFEVRGETLHRLFTGHPLLETSHYLIYRYESNFGDYFDYLFVHAIDP